MATKNFCDGCGKEIKAWKAGDPSTGDGLARSVTLYTGNNHQKWDLCDPCQDKVANALTEILPSTLREDWWDSIRPTKRA